MISINWSCPQETYGLLSWLPCHGPPSLVISSRKFLLDQPDGNAPVKPILGSLMETSIFFFQLMLPWGLEYHSPLSSHSASFVGCSCHDTIGLESRQAICPCLFFPPDANASLEACCKSTEMLGTPVLGSIEEEPSRISRRRQSNRRVEVNQHEKDNSRFCLQRAWVQLRKSQDMLIGWGINLGWESK